MEHSKLAKGNEDESPIGRFQAGQMNPAESGARKAVRKKAVTKKANCARPLQKKMGSKSNSDKLVCRYCGSNDLAPSFIQRRDRRCRECFSKRYGSAARARKPKVKS
jgi:hypothetical protein